MPFVGKGAHRRSVVAGDAEHDAERTAVGDPLQADRAVCRPALRCGEDLVDGRGEGRGRHTDAILHLHRVGPWRAGADDV